MAKHESFLIKHDVRPLIDNLTDEQAGMLLKALMSFSTDGKSEDFGDPLLSATYAMMTGHIEEYDRRWQETCEKNRENVRKRWNKDDTEESSRIPDDTTVYGRIGSNTNHTDRIREDRIREDKTGQDGINKIHTRAKKPVEKPVEEKKAYGDEFGNVLLTDKEYQRLVEKHGEADTKAAIEYFDSWYEDKEKNKPPNKRTKSHYAAIIRWVFDAVAEKKQKQQKQAKSDNIYQAIDNWYAKEVEKDEQARVFGFG